MEKIPFGHSVSLKEDEQRMFTSNIGFGLPELMILVILALLSLLTVLPLWFICKKAGFSPTISLLGLFPIVGTILMFYLAFADWPVLRQSTRT